MAKFKIGDNVKIVSDNEPEGYPLSAYDRKLGDIGVTAVVLGIGNEYGKYYEVDFDHQNRVLDFIVLSEDELELAEDIH